MPPRLTQEQKQAITAALFRQETYSHIAATHGVSKRRLSRIAHCLRTWGTTHPPQTKPMGRPKTITDEIGEGLREYVNAHPLSNIEEMQNHIENTFHLKCSFRAISRRLKDLGYTRSIVQRGNRSLEKDNLPNLSETDRQRLQADPAASDLLDKPKVTYAWLLTSAPVSSGLGRASKVQKSSSGRKKKNSTQAARPPSLETLDGQDEDSDIDDMFEGDDSAAAALLHSTSSPFLSNTHPPHMSTDAMAA
ncbi:hypothetical protein FQN50_003177 [Emmonsiellopsis sp. PD_5]|nr:hypothetical protein FQN50_003177 [Emmonsiellopsis sp. PD_5]